MKLPRAPAAYQPNEVQIAFTLIERADQQNHKRGRDIEIHPGRLILTSPNGTRWSLTVDNSGTVSATAV